jgi:hypothetical protein
VHPNPLVQKEIKMGIKNEMRVSVLWVYDRVYEKGYNEWVYDGVYSGVCSKDIYKVQRGYIYVQECANIYKGEKYIYTG